MLLHVLSEQGGGDGGTWRGEQELLQTGRQGCRDAGSGCSLELKQVWLRERIGLTGGGRHGAQGSGTATHGCSGTTA